MNLKTHFLPIAGLMLLAFAMYAFGPTVRSKLSPAIPAAPCPVSDESVAPAKVASKGLHFPSPPILYGTLHPNKVGVRVVSFPVLAGEEVSISNADFTYLKIESDDPIAAKVGNCSSDKTKFFVCDDATPEEPIIIRDLRIGLAPDTSSRNLVKITAVKP